MYFVGRAQKKIEKLEQLLKLAKSDYKQLGGGPTEDELREREELQAADRFDSSIAVYVFIINSKYARHHTE